MNLPGLKDDLLSLLADADTIERVFNHVVMGGTLIGFCALNNVPYPVIRKWIRSDKDREKIYQNALDERDEALRESILAELRLISFLDVSKIFGPNGEILPPDDWPDEIKRNVAALQVKEEYETVEGHKIFTGYTKTIKFHDKIKAIDLHGKNLKLWQSDKSDSANIKLEDLLALSRKLEKESNE